MDIIIKNKILNWLANGKTGISSRFMAFCIFDIETEYGHPHDPADFNRCLLFLQRVPEARNYFNKIKTMSVQWGRLINNWDKIEKCFIDEVGLDWCKSHIASKTYDLMRLVLDDE